MKKIDEKDETMSIDDEYEQLLRKLRKTAESEKNKYWIDKSPEEKVSYFIRLATYCLRELGRPHLTRLLQGYLHQPVKDNKEPYCLLIISALFVYVMGLLSNYNYKFDSLIIDEITDNVRDLIKSIHDDFPYPITEENFGVFLDFVSRDRRFRLLMNLYEALINLEKFTED